MQDTIKTKGKVILICLGGAGFNVGSRLEEHRNSNDKSFANLESIYVDTSRSNLNSTINPNHVYFIDGLDGSGKVRAENHQIIAQHIPVILQRYNIEEGDVVVVLHSLSGGSGSVAGPLMVSELLNRDIPTVAVTIGSADTKIEANNTLKTLKSYAAIVEMREKPLALSYLFNSIDKGRDLADSMAVRSILALCALYSRENEELDSKDLAHWLQFNKTTSFKPQLAALTLVEAGDTMPPLGNIISVATLAKRGDRTALVNPPEYQTVGYLTEEADTNLRKRAPLHFIISDGVLAAAAKQLQSVIDKFEASGGIRQNQGITLSGNDRPVNTGLVL